MKAPRIVAVIQARMGSTRLPGKVLEPIGDRSLLAWTVAGVQAVPGLATVVVATTTEPRDDPLVEAAAALGTEVHRGPVFDVLTRCFDAVAPHAPDLVLRQTADNPFPDPSVATAQVETLRAQGLDYVGIAGWPIGVAAEVCRMEAFTAAMDEATAAADREHVTPYLTATPSGSESGPCRGPPRSRPGEIGGATPSIRGPTSSWRARWPTGSATGRPSASPSSRRSWRRSPSSRS